MSIKGAFKEIVGLENYSKLQSLKSRLDGGEKTLTIGKFDIKFPSGHILPSIWRSDSKRNLALGIVAGELSKKYPRKPVIDIGANVGDTAALIASYSQAPLVLVEPSDLYFPFLIRNTAGFRNEITVHKAFVFANTEKSGSLIHEAGTAHFAPGAGDDVACISLTRLAENPSLIKVDTDGFDYEILLANLEFIRTKYPALYFENSIYSDDDLRSANKLAIELTSAGYQFLVFTATGQYLCATCDPGTISDLNGFLFRSTLEKTIQIYYYDMLCIAKNDVDVYRSMLEYFRI